VACWNGPPGSARAGRPAAGRSLPSAGWPASADGGLLGAARCPRGVAARKALGCRCCAAPSWPDPVAIRACNAAASLAPARVAAQARCRPRGAVSEPPLGCGQGPRNAPAGGCRRILDLRQAERCSVPCPGIRSRCVLQNSQPRTSRPVRPDRGARGVAATGRLNAGQTKHCWPLGVSGAERLGPGSLWTWRIRLSRS